MAVEIIINWICFKRRSSNVSQKFGLKFISQINYYKVLCVKEIAIVYKEKQVEINFKYRINPESIL